jgi:hypothetical protein
MIYPHIKRKLASHGWPVRHHIADITQTDEAKHFSDEPVTRNINCKHYSTCLETAARANDKELGCANCLFRHDNSYRMNDVDFSNLIKLYYTIISDLN